MNNIINLEQLLRKVFAYWKSTILVGLVCCIATVAAGMYLFPQKRFMAEVFRAPASVDNQYLLLNAALERLTANAPETDKEAAKEQLSIDRNSLLTSFNEFLVLRNGFADAMISSGLIKKRADETDQMFLQRARSRVYSVAVSLPSRPGRGRVRGNERLQLSFSTKDSAAGFKFINEVFEINTKAVQQYLVESINTRLDLVESSKRDRFRALDRARENAIARYDQLLINRLSFLKEQAKIARSLSIAKNTLEAEKLNDNTSLISREAGSEPYYLRGYEAIEKDIELQSNRENKEAFIGKLVDIDQSIRVQKQNRVVENVRESIALTPLMNEGFKAVYTDVISVSTKRAIPVTVLLFMGLLFSGFAMIIWLASRSQPKDPVQQSE